MAPLGLNDFSGGERTVARHLRELGSDQLRLCWNQLRDRESLQPTPRHSFGYSDGPQEEGTFAYTGEGQHGDMEFTRGNRAIRDHVTDAKDLLLFEDTGQSGKYRFLGCYACGGWTVREVPDRDGAQRNAIIFRLVPLSVETGDAELDEARQANHWKNYGEQHMPPRRRPQGRQRMLDVAFLSAVRL
jgi:hypothetical protein